MFYLKFLNNYNAFMWTGGGGNIYEENEHNKSQLEFCSNILKKMPNITKNE